MIGKKKQKIMDLFEFVSLHNKLPERGQVYRETKVYQIYQSIRYRKTYREFWKKLREHPLLSEMIDGCLISDSKQIEKTPVSRVDIPSRKNILESTEYVNELYEMYKTKESSSMNISLDVLEMESSRIDFSMRAILVDWLVQIHHHFEFVPETLYLAVNILDRFLSLKTLSITKTKLQCVGITALFIASKYEEICPLSIQNILHLTTFSKDYILKTENEILFTLEFKITVVTPYVFLLRFLKAAHADKRMTNLASYLLEKTLQEKCYNLYSPSMLAATSVALALQTIRQGQWTRTLKDYTKYEIEELNACKRHITFISRKKIPKLRTVEKKYMSKKFYAVSRIEI